MTLLDTLRDRVRATSSAADPHPDPDPLPWWQAPTAGGLAAASSWLVLALPALVVWVATAHTTVGWGQALGVASAAWFLGHGAVVGVDAVSLSLAPLGVTLLALALTWQRARRLLDVSERSAPGTTFARLVLRRLAPGFVAGYAAFALLAGLLTLAGPARPHPVSALAVLGIPVIALAVVLLDRYAAEEETGPVQGWLDRLPRWVPRAVRPGLWGVGALLALGALLVLGMVVARWSTVSGLQAAVGADAVGAVVLAAAQLLLTPNLALWAVGWLAGPGFQIADGSSISLSGAHPGLMPMVPVLGALPSDGTWSRWLVLALAAPTLIGGLVGGLACRPLARLSSWRTKLVQAATAAAATTLFTVALAVLGSGSVGVDRLRSVGVHPTLLGAALLVELLVGAAGYVLAAQLRLRMRHR